MTTEPTEPNTIAAEADLAEALTNHQAAQAAIQTVPDAEVPHAVGAEKVADARVTRARKRLEDAEAKVKAWQAAQEAERQAEVVAAEKEQTLALHENDEQLHGLITSAFGAIGRLWLERAQDEVRLNSLRSRLGLPLIANADADADLSAAFSQATKWTSPGRGKVPAIDLLASWHAHGLFFAGKQARAVAKAAAVKDMAAFNAKQREDQALLGVFGREEQEAAQDRQRESLRAYHDRGRAQ